jgi:site-specific recombinase XerD
MSTIPTHLMTTPADPIAHLMTTGAGWGGLIGAWLAEVQQRTGSTRTPTEYGRYAAHFAARLDARGLTLAEATAADAHAFAYAPLPDRRRGGVPGRAPGPASVNVRLAAIRSLYDFARRVGAVAGNPADAVKRPQLPQPAPKGLTPAQTRALLAALPDSRAGRRDRAIILTAVLTGLRREELVGLTAGALQLDDDGTPMYTARTKGGKLRYRELPAPAWQAITEYLTTTGRALDTLAPDDRIFPVTSQTVYDNLRRYGRAIGVEGLTVHSLRHTAAKLRRQAGASLEDVQAVLGHSSVATTARYLARLEGTRDPGWQAAAALLDPTP